MLNKIRIWDGTKLHYNYEKNSIVGQALIAYIFKEQNDLYKGFEFMHSTGVFDDTKWEELQISEQEDWLQKGHTQKQWQGYELYENDVVLKQLPYKEGQYVCPCDISYLNGMFCVGIDILAAGEWKKIGNIYNVNLQNRDIYETKNYTKINKGNK